MRCNGLLGGGKILSSWKQSLRASKKFIATLHYAKHSLMLGGSEGMPAQKNLINRCSEIESEVILESNYMHVI